jgi:alkaline phosphatase D
VPPAGAPLDRLRIAVASCQQYEHGYYTAYRHMLDDELDCIVHVGDYIYEQSWGELRVRRHDAPEAYTLEDYRARYALYRSDPDLRAAHARYPWLVVWDDHEVDNDYAAEVSEENDDPALFLARRAAAYQAFYEHMPLPRRAVPFGPNMRLYAQAVFGDLASVFLLDQRQYRAPHACPRAGRRGSGRVGEECAELRDANRSMLGERQEAWLLGRLQAPRTRWNLLAQGTLMSHIDERAGAGRLYWTDSWNGYPVARQRLLDGIAARRTPNPVMLAGDIHAFLAGGINARPDEPDSPVLASEFVTTSITSEGKPGLAQYLAENPNLRLATGDYRGYLRLTLEREHMLADLVALDDVHRPDSPRRVLQSFVVRDSVPGPVPA